MFPTKYLHSSFLRILEYWMIAILLHDTVQGLLSVSVQYEPDVHHNESFISNSCSISKSSSGLVSLHVNDDTNCNVSIMATDDGLQGDVIILNVLEANIKGTDYLYIESRDENSPSRFAAFSGDFKSYKIAFSEKNLSLYARTTAVITIYSNYRNDSASVPMFRWNEHNEIDSRVSVFDKVMYCPLDTFEFATIARCKKPCLDNCKCSLQSRALDMQCQSKAKSKGNEINLNSKTLLIFPPEFNALDLASNGLTNIEINSLGNTFQSSQGIQWLYLDNNSLTVLKKGVFYGLNEVGFLDLSYSQLSHIESGAFVGLVELDELYLDYNNLTTLESNTFRGLNRLATLHLCCNQIKSLPAQLFKDLGNLEWLSLADNNLVVLNYHTFVGINLGGVMCLEQLALQKNSLTQLPEELPRLLPNLTTLNLAFNSLKQLPKFENLPRLKTLDLRSNPLKKVKKETFNGLVSRTVLLVDEPGTCCFTGSAQCNATNAEPPYLTCERLLPNLTLRMFMWILGWSALLGNLFVLIWRCIGKMEEDRVQSHLITNLALSDMLTGIYMLILVFADIHFEKYFPSYAEQWRTGPVCKLAGVLALTACEASVFFVTLISLDRFIRVVYPHSIHRLTPQSTQTAAVMLWAISLTLGVVAIAFVGVNNDVYDISEVCIGLPLVRKSVYKVEVVRYKPPEWFVTEPSVSVSTQIGTVTGMYFSIAIFLGLNLICFIIVMFCYMAILKAVRDTSKRVKLARHRDREIRMAAKMFLIVATDFLCWVPIIFTGILVQSNAVEISPEMFAWAVTFILPINSSVNPYLYTITTMLTKRLGCRQSACTGSTGLSEKSERASRSGVRENGSARMMVTGSTRQNGVTLELATKV